MYVCSLVTILIISSFIKVNHKLSGSISTLISKIICYQAEQHNRIGCFPHIGLTNPVEITDLYNYLIIVVIVERICI